jgi:hypothetical protein
MVGASPVALMSIDATVSRGARRVRRPLVAPPHRALCAMRRAARHDVEQQVLRRRK